MDAPRLASNPRFEVHELLGSGAMGDVFRATDKARGTQVAIKVLRRLDARSLLGFKSEFRAIANLTHPNILQLYDLIAEGDEWLLVMELVTGTDFLRFVRPSASGETTSGDADFETFASATFTGPADVEEHASVARSKREHRVQPRRRAALGPLHEGRLRGALRQLADGLHELHQRGFVHRDLKPDNVLVFA
ncbi:MAG: protein kinase, partial [Polyangiales bacterium]